jgi:hypothetical protein
MNFYFSHFFVCQWLRSKDRDRWLEDNIDPLRQAPSTTFNREIGYLMNYNFVSHKMEIIRNF